MSAVLMVWGLCPSIVVRVAIIWEPIEQRPFKFQLWLPLGHTPDRFRIFENICIFKIPHPLNKVGLTPPFFVLAAVVSDNFLMFTDHDNRSLYQIDLNSSPSMLVQYLGVRDILYYPFAVAYDPNEQKVYWTEHDPDALIRSAYLDGSSVTTFTMNGQSCFFFFLHPRKS